MRLSFVETSIGTITVVENKKLVERIYLPEKNPGHQAMRDYPSIESKEIPSRPIKDLINAWDQGQSVKVPKSLFNWKRCGAFQSQVLQKTIRIKRGETLTYGELASEIQKPGGAQAVGNALGTNPFPLLIPCHRVLGAGTSLGGFTSEFGTDLKREILKHEGVSLQNIKGDSQLQYFKSNYKKLTNMAGCWPEGFIEWLPSIELENGADPFKSLVRSLVYQQLSTKAASTIHQRTIALLASNQSEQMALNLLLFGEKEKKQAGLSTQKLSYLKELASAYLSGNIPSLSQAKKMGDQQLVRKLSQVKGVGIWSVQMYLIFGLARVDQFAPADLALQKGIQIIFDLKNRPNPREANELALKFTGKRTLLSLLLWRLHDYLASE